MLGELHDLAPDVMAPPVLELRPPLIVAASGVSCEALGWLISPTAAQDNVVRLG